MLALSRRHQRGATAASKCKSFPSSSDDVPGGEQPEPDDLLELLAQEVARLPEKYRLPVQLCYFGGLTTAEAADRLGCPKGTVLTRLAWARERLKKSLAGRGVSAAIPGAALQAVSRHWVDTTVRAGLSILAGTSPALVGVSRQTVSLTEGVLRNMVWNKLKYVLLGALLALGGSGLGIHHWVTASDDSPVVRKAQKDKAEARGVAPLAVPADKEPEAGAEQPEKKAKTPAEIRPGRRREAVIRLPLGLSSKMSRPRLTARAA